MSAVLRFFLTICTVPLLLAMPLVARAESGKFIVTLRDVQNKGVVATIVVTDLAGKELARGQTSDDGVATFDTLAANTVKVRVTGQLNASVALQQLGQDADGIQFTLDAPGTQLNLRVDVDGTVLPDPETMWALESPPSTAVAVSIPEAPRAGSVPPALQPTARSEQQANAAPAQGSNVAPTDQSAPAASDAALPWFVYMAVVLLIVLLVSLVFAERLARLWATAQQRRRL